MDRPSRRDVTAVLGGGSILSSPATARFLDTTASYLEVTLPFFFLYETLAGTGGITVSLTWLFLGYLVYAYTPELYLGMYGDIVQQRGFRVLTAAITGYFGVLSAAAVGIAPDRGPFVVVPEATTMTLIGVGAGIILGTVAFSGYLWIHGQSAFAADSDLFALTEAFTVRSQQGTVSALEELPPRLRQVVVLINNVGMGVFFVLPCFFMGFGFVFVGLFSPVPEAIVVTAILIGKLPGGGSSNRRIPAPSDSDIEFRIVDQITDALANTKGLILAGFCLIGFGISGVWFLIAAAVLPEATAALSSMSHHLGSETVSRLSGQELTQIGLTLWTAIGLVAVLLGFGSYGLWYWFRQLQRLPTYAAVWETSWHDGAESPPAPPVDRPRLLFLPGGLLMAPLVAALWFMSINRWPSTEAFAVIAVSWPLAVGVASWSVLTTERARPQPATGDGVRITAAVLVQLSVVYLAGWVSTSGTQADLAFLGVLWLLVGGIAYWPDVDVYAEGQSGLQAYFGWGYLLTLSTAVAVAIELLVDLPWVVYGVFGLVILIGIGLKTIEEHARRP